MCLVLILLPRYSVLLKNAGSHSIFFFFSFLNAFRDRNISSELLEISLYKTYHFNYSKTRKW